MGLTNVIKKDMNFLNKLFAHCDICGKIRPDTHVIASFGGWSYVEKEHYYLHKGCANVKLENPTSTQERAQEYYNNGKEILSAYLSFRQKARAIRAEVGLKF